MDNNFLIVTREELVGVADAIREKGEFSKALQWPEEFKTAIGELSSIPEDEYKDSDDVIISGPEVKVAAGYYEEEIIKNVQVVEQATPTIDINDSGLITAEVSQIEGYVEEGIKSNTKQLTTQAAKTITPTTSEQIAVNAGVYTTGAIKVAAMPTAAQATPSISIDSAGKITASATQSAGYVAAGTKSGTKQLTVQAAQTITPGTSNKTIASGRYLTGTQTIKGDSNLQAANIKKGVSIFGVSGTLEEKPIGIPVFAYSGEYSTYIDPNDPSTWEITLKSSGTFNCEETIADILVVGGGGAGGMLVGGGGGGGNVTTHLYKTIKGNYDIVIGAGGQSNSASGGASSGFGLNAAGGNGGGSNWGGGGSGCGGYGNGGRSWVDTNSQPHGGNGLIPSGFEDLSYFGGGGGGGTYQGWAGSVAGTGGKGGGGNGARAQSTAGGAGVNYKGGGGGGGAGGDGPGGKGGCGVIIIRNAR